MVILAIGGDTREIDELHQDATVAASGKSCGIRKCRHKCTSQFVRIKLQIKAHFRQQVATDFFLPILQGREFFAEVQAPVATLAFIADEYTNKLPASGQALNAPLELRTFDYSSVGQICPNVRRDCRANSTDNRNVARMFTA